MKKIALLFLYSLFTIHHSLSQDTCGLRISLLTCAPGTELYSTFGHTAVRVTNGSTGQDDVYNYGTFDGFDPDFYGKFVRGKLLYALSVESFRDFLVEYQMESRSVIEQTLSLPCEQKQRLLQRLQTNALPQHRNYRYDFLFDNCTTRARDMIDTGAGAPVRLATILKPKPLTFREHITVYLRKVHQDWSKLGIDLLLGAKMDRAASNTEAMFLPDNLMAAFDGARVDGRPLVGKKETVLPMPSVATESFFFTPFVSFGLLLALALALTLTKKRWAQTAVGIFDFLFFLVTGLVGVLLLFMWFGTDHALCANNYNLFWAVPANAVAAFFVHKRSGWPKRYFGGLACLTILLLAAWGFLPQEMNNGFLPLVLTSILRSAAIAKRKTDAGKRI